MLTMNHDLDSALRHYLHLLDEKEYFEAHEVLEEAWHPLRLSKHPLANLLKGLINGAIGFEHLKRNRKNASSKAQKVMASYERYKYLCEENIVYYPLFVEALKKIEGLKVEHQEIFNV